MKITRSLCCAMLAGVVLCVFAVAAQENNPAAILGAEQLAKIEQQGNYKDAYEGYRKLALNPQADPRRVGNYRAGRTAAGDREKVWPDLHDGRNRPLSAVHDLGPQIL